MLSLTSFSLNTCNLFQQPSILISSKPKFISKTIGNNHTKTPTLHCFSCNNVNDSLSTSNLSCGTKFDTNPDATFFDTEWSAGFSDQRLLVLWLRSCSRVKDVKRVHALLLKCLRNLGTYVNNNLISGYLQLGELSMARKVFDVMPERSVVSWTAMINGYVSFSLENEALRLFSEFVENGFVGNARTFVCVLNLCSKRLAFELGRQIHACVVKGNWTNLIVDSTIISFYAQCGDLKSAFCAFDRMRERDVVCWTSAICACSQHGCGEKAFRLFSHMLREGFSPNEFTVCAVLKACGEKKVLNFGRQLHCAIVKGMCKDDVFVGTSLVDMYAKCGEMMDSSKVFNRMRNRNTVTWTSIIAGYARKGFGEEALCLFRTMKRWKIISNNLTVVSVLRACGSISASLTGREVHAQIIKSGIQSNVYIGSTLVWFYCKCGDFDIASRVLQLMPFRNVVSWTAMISGHAGLGYESEALEFLKEMLEEGIEPNEFTCSSALKACANIKAVVHGKLIHSFTNKTPASSNVFVGSALIYMYSKCGRLSDAIQVFDSMQERNLISWKTMILSYARSGHCREALKLMYRMQAEGIKIDDYIYTSVMGACGDVDWNVESSSEYSLQSR